MSQAIATWITIQRTAVFPCWRLIAWDYVISGEPCWNGSPEILIRTLNANGDYQQGVKVWQAFPSDKASDVTKKKGDLTYCGQNYGMSFFMSGNSNFHPEKGEAGPYSCYVDGASDSVHGMGLVGDRHDQYLLTFQWVTNPTPPPPPPPTTDGHWVIGSGSTQIHVVTDWVTP